MNKKTYILTVAVLLIIAIGAYYFPTGGTVVERIKERTLGAAAGPEHTEHQVFKQSFTHGGTAVSTTSDVAAATMTTGELRRDVNYITWNADLNVTITSPASTSAPFADMRTGEKITVDVYSATTTAATTMTWAAGTGVDLQEDEGETVIQNGLETARLTFIKKADSDVLMWVEVAQVGD